ncbi:DUF3137 domain-containing protein [Peptidiphaga gingivicola]|uniref:DUF3137 domain-containing protein n=1 Tax=Peptidiphaga gingivicola TaxID=2741497 RepID=UPI000AF5ADA0|nr:DUF3137 domain-containing protein [Peptidiphaga gingivicola]
MTAAITEVDDPVNKTLAIGLFTFIFVSVGLYAVYFFIISRYLRGRWARNNGVQLIKSDRDLGRQTRDVFDLAGWDHCAYDVLIIPTNAGNAKYYEVRWFTRDSQGSLGSSEGRKVQHSKAYFYYPLPGFLPYITIEPERRFGRANDDINTEWQAFNKAFDVRSSDEQTAHALLAGPVQEFLMDRMRDYRLTFTDDELYLSVGRYKAKRSLAYGPVLDEFVSRVPAFVFSQE